MYCTIRLIRLLLNHRLEICHGDVGVNESVIDEEEVAGLGPVAKMLTSHTSALAHDLWCLWNFKAYANHLTTPSFFSQIKKKMAETAAADLQNSSAVPRARWYV